MIFFGFRDIIFSALRCSSYWLSVIIQSLSKQ